MERRPDIDLAVAYIRAQLRSGPRLVGDLIAHSGMHIRTLERAARRLNVVRSRAGRRGPWRWELSRWDRLF
jgi:hypothetical protein